MTLSTQVKLTSGMPFEQVHSLHDIAVKIRKLAIDMSYRAQTPHLGSALSCIDILTVAYWCALKIDTNTPNHPDRDRFVFSKGHAIPALYGALALRGFFPESLLETFACEGSKMTEQPSPGAIPGVELATGSLGHGLPVALGMALSAKILGKAYRVFALMSDGECNEGSVWEAALFAPAHKLDNVVVIIDYNKWQATGRSEEVMALAPLKEKWAAFGWDAREVDGHDHMALEKILTVAPSGNGKPLAVIAHTVKGKGVSFMEDDNNWHYKIPDALELNRAHDELNSSLKER